MIVESHQLTHRYNERLALDQVSFRVAEGEIFGLLGPNGGGKSTLFRILATLQRPASGTATIGSFDILRQGDDVRKQIGVVFQTQSLDRKLTVDENLTAQGHLHGLHGKSLSDRISQVLQRLDLFNRRGDIVETLSGGLKRRAEIAKALLHRPRVLLMDEASTGLDPTARRELWRFLSELRRDDGVTILLTSHILEEAEQCDRLALIHEGKLVTEGTPAALKQRIGGDVVVLDSANSSDLAARIQSQFAIETQSMNGTVRIEIENGHRFIAQVIEAFPGAIESVSLHKPTLEDVFVRETGASLW